jgi:hypothetical protein
MATGASMASPVKILVNQWRNERPPRDGLAHHLAFTKRAQEPECGHKTAMFSGRTVYVLGLLVRHEVA